jgi:hypothetical protein
VLEASVQAGRHREILAQAQAQTLANAAPLRERSSVQICRSNAAERVVDVVPQGIRHWSSSDSSGSPSLGC